MAREERMQKNLLRKLVMLEDVVIMAKYKHLPQSVLMIMWKDSHGLIRTPKVKHDKVKRKVVRRGPDERWQTYCRRVQEVDDEYVRAALAADPSIPRNPPQPVLMATARTRLTPTLREEEIGQANGSVSDGAAVTQVEAGDATRSRHGSGVDAVRTLCTLLGHPAGGPQTHQFELASYLYQTHTVVPAHSGCAHGSHVSACARNGDALSSTYSQT